MKRFKVFFLTLILSCSMFLGSVAPVNAAAAAVGTLASILGTTVLTSAVGTATSALVNSWLGVNRGYYNGSGSSTSYDYSNNMARNTNLTAGGNITNSGANNDNCWNTYTTTTTTNNTYSLVRNQFDTTVNQYKTEVYNPVTNNYHTVNNVQYSQNYNTYYMETNNYNYYITNNYNYVSYYITNTTNNTTNYYEIYYELPDGRNSFYLTASEVWGEYFIYDVTRADVVAEDDGRTLALYHLDGNTVDSSFYECTPLPLSTGMYSEGRFDEGLEISGQYSFPTTFNLFDHVPFTIEFFIRSNGLTGDDLSLKAGVSHVALQFDELVPSGATYEYPLDVYCNGRLSYSTHVLQNAFSIGSTGYIQPFGINTSNFYLYFSGKYVLDEVRISKGHVYSDYYNVPAQPFDTNEILVLPDEADEGQIIIASKSDFSNYRIGGVRPTYPSQGFIHISMNEDGSVYDIQQYDAGSWDSCEGKIYKGGQWYDLKGFNLEHFAVPDTEGIDGTTGSGGGGNSTDSDENDDDGDGLLSGGFSSIVKAITNFFGLMLDAIGKVINTITEFFSSFLSMFDSFTVFSEGFGSFLSSAFIFLPSEVISALVVGINICVVIAVFKFMRN